MPTSTPTPTLTLPQGTYAGGQHYGAEYFRGVPYAGGVQRFRPPTRLTVDPRPSPIDARQQGPTPIAPPSRLSMVMGADRDSGPQSEEHSAVLSVYRPPGAAALPIFFWIHGGAFVSGSSQSSFYDGSRLARDANAVVVAVNYRLGALGFLYDPDTRHQPRPAESFGTLDLVAALEWVASHAAALGGDSGNITAFGQSAGGFLCAELLVLRPQLVARAIIQSSTASVLASVDDALAIRALAATFLPSGATFDTMSPEQAIAVHSQTAGALPAHNLDFGLGMPFFPVLPPSAGPGGGRPNHNPDVPGASDPRRVPVFVTYTANDGDVFRRMASQAGLSDAEIDALPPTALRSNPGWAAASVDYAHFLRQRGHAVSLAEWVWRPAGSAFGAVHTIDVPLLLGTQEAWAGTPMLGSESWDEVDAKGKVVRQAWGAFARGVWPASIDGVLDVLEEATAK
ncbi:Carboxylesterase [Vanrija pseudolonga]|uniref:Carboxylesterase n=1 Tax=Vanrija pseudolonga TaxID=143232 RepID=A0AAF0Y4Z5_9TREE|nr:Carboxylesterase [Vanrija pseudolonga]